MSRIVVATVGYNINDGTIAKFTPDEQRQLQEAMLDRSPRFSFSDSGEFQQWHEERIWFLDLLPNAALATLKVSRVVQHPRIDEVMQRSGTVINQRVNVAVPGFGLLQIRHAQVFYDLCTVELDRLLKEGWCILAICPQPDQRRPDYILGKPHREDDSPHAQV